MDGLEFVLGLLNGSLAIVLTVMILFVLGIPRLFFAGVEKHAGRKVTRDLQIFLSLILLLFVENISTIFHDLLYPGKQYPLKLRLALSLFTYGGMLISFVEPFLALIRLGRKSVARSPEIE